ncbi:MAG: GYDIA family GHMP kinase [Maribacter sp.]|nr:GYDIA family GHMP kinase [Maribacter sp.]
MERQFYSNGKLLLTGEYVVLDGALSLALPTTYGQFLKVKKTMPSTLVWKSFDEHGTIWFETTFALSEFSGIQKSEASTPRNTLRTILFEAQRLNPTFLNGRDGFEIETKLTFPRNWGLGSSSTLINNIAQWANVDAYILLRNSFGGSGYDIACANHNLPILFHLKNGIPHVQEIDFMPTFENHLYFVYLNKKQNSLEGITRYRKLKFDRAQLVARISKISGQMSFVENLETFVEQIEMHEKLLSEILQIPTVKEDLFSDYPGAIKSLGAWGGDFVMATGDTNCYRYFKKKGYETVIPYSEMILSRKK